MAWVIAKGIEESRIKEVLELLQRYSYLERRRAISAKFKRTSVLYMAVEIRHLPLVNYLLDECGADPNDTGYENGMDCPCLWKAADLSDLKIAESLVQHGADVNGVNRLESTALLRACHRGNLVMVEYLCNHRANINNADFEGFTCLMASVYDYPEICQYLLSKGAKVDAVNSRGESALILAIEYRDFECVSYLIAAGADPTINTDEGENCLFMAAKDTTGEIRRYLQAQTQNRNMSRYYSLFTAVESCRYTISRFESLPYTRLKSLMREWDFELKIPMCETTMVSFSRSELKPIKHLLHPKDAKALMFLESIMGFRNLFTLRLMKKAISKVDDVDDCVTVFKYFIDLIDLADTDIFFQMSKDIYDLVRQFYSHKLHEYFAEEDVREYDIVKYLVSHLESARNRLEAISYSARLAKMKYIQIYFDLIGHLIGAIEFVFPRKIGRLHKYISQIVKLDLRCVRNSTLLYFAMKNNYRWSTIQTLLSCGADVNSTDDFGDTAAHVALNSPRYCTQQIITRFIRHGLNINRIAHQNDCLLCLLKKKNVLYKPFHCSSLKCMSATAMVKYGLSIDLTFPEVIHDLICSHFNIYQF